MIVRMRTIEELKEISKSSKCIQVKRSIEFINLPGFSKYLQFHGTKVNVGNPLTLEYTDSCDIAGIDSLYWPLDDDNFRKIYGDMFIVVCAHIIEVD